MGLRLLHRPRSNRHQQHQQHLQNSTCGQTGGTKTLALPEGRPQIAGNGSPVCTTPSPTELRPLCPTFPATP